MRNRLIAFIVMICTTLTSKAQIATYTGASGTSTAVVGVPNEAVTTLQAVGFGANTACTSGGLSGITVNTIWTTYSTAGPHVYFKITPNAGYMLNITGFTAGLRRSGTGPVNTRFAYSLDNGTTWINDGVDHTASSGGCGTTLVSSWGGGTLPTGITSTTNGIIVALFPFAPGSSTGTYQVNTIVINGSVTPSCVAPVAYTVTGGGSYCSGGSGVAIGLSNSTTSVSYQLYNGAATVGSPVSGTSGSPISFGLQTAAGTYSVLATSTPGCTTPMTGTAVITVYTSPSAISGITTICAGGTSTLGNAIAGGTWSSSTPAVGSISTTGVVSALTSGTTTITYTMTGGCISTTVVTVNPSPSAISGTTLVCQGTTSTLSNTAAGGAWTSSNTTVATIGASNGIVNGLTAGTSVITYSITACAAVTTVVTVSPFAPVTGPGTVCEGSSIALSDAAAGGTWNSSSTGTATVSTTGVVTGVVAGTVNISYTTPGCVPAIATVTVNVMPAAISGPSDICLGFPTTFSNSVAGGTWVSTNTSVATITSGGVVTGVATGTTMLSYTMPGGCFVTMTVTVNPAPGAITGPSSVCGGQTITMANSLSGGVWSSTPNATVGAASGVVTGVTGGTANISYTTTGCAAVTKTITVNPLAPITGLTNLCLGYTTTLHNSIAGGAWSSGAPSIASVSTSGVVTPVSPGTTNISYIMSTGCFSTIVVTVNALGPITGSLTVCQGSVTTLSNLAPGGTWSATPSSVASAITLSATTGQITGVAPGVATVSYSLPSGCLATATLLVNALPGAIAGPSAVCESSSITLNDPTAGGSWSSTSANLTINTSGVVTGITSGTGIVTYMLPTTCYVTKVIAVNPLPVAIAPSAPWVCMASTIALTDATPGGTWISSNTAVATIGSSTGIASGITAGISIITYQLTATGCRITELLHVNTPPAAIAGTSTVCEASSVVLTNTVPGGTWTSSAASVATVGSSSGTVSGVSVGIVTISYTTTACVPQQYQVTVYPLPAPIMGFGSVCVGSTTTLFDVTPGGTWSASGTNASVTSSGVVSGLSYGTSSVVSYTLPTGCYRAVPILVDSLPAPIVGPDSVCPGTSMTLTDISPDGLWSSSDGTKATAIALTGEIIGVHAGTVHISYTLISGCYVEKTVTVPNPLPASVSITQSPTTSPLCEGTPVTFTANPVNGGTPTYQWRLFGVPIDTGTTITYTPHHGDYIMLIMFPHDICASPFSGVKDSVLMAMYPHATPSINIMTSTSPPKIEYPGQVVTFFSDVTFGGTAPTFQWYRDGVAIPGATSNSYATPVYSTEEYYCKLTSNAPCRAFDVATSDTIAILSVVGVPGSPAVAGNLSLYPNPNNGSFTLKGRTGAATGGDARIEVVDMLGVIVYTASVPLRNGELNEQVRLDNILARGGYMLKLTTPTGSEVVHFVIE